MKSVSTSSCVAFLSNWLLPIAMITGTVLYFLLSKISFFVPFRPNLLVLVDILLPLTIFGMLFFAFSKIEIKEMKPDKWHFILLISQAIMCVGCMLIIYFFLKQAEFSDILAEGILACLLSPTAAASAVITGKLGGSSASLSTYTMESNILSAILITTLCPIIHPIVGLNVFEAFLMVLYKISILLILPFVCAQLIKYTLPRLHKRIIAIKDASYYLWGFSLMLVTGLTMRVVVQNMSDVVLEMALVVGAAIICGFKFAYGKFIGHLYSQKDKVSAGQAFGQKNTTFTIWMALTFLSPVSAVAPGSYVIWQNIVNSYQLWRKRKIEHVNTL